jgi:thymidylate synthase ThyX
MQIHTEGHATARTICSSTYQGSQLFSLEITFPRALLAEFNTHRILSKNSASSRAVPLWKRIRSAIDNPFIPTSLGRNKAGMQAGDILPPEDHSKARDNWLVSRDAATVVAFHFAGGAREILAQSKHNPDAYRIIDYIENLQQRYSDTRSACKTLSVPLHKQHAARILEPYLYHTVIVTGTHWRNLLALRASEQAQPEMQDVSIAIARALKASTPKALSLGEWHRPYIDPGDIEETNEPKLLSHISAGRCARVSSLNHNGVRSIDDDIRLADSLLRDGHMSPFEHVAQAGERKGYNGNLSTVWTQYRKILRDENDFSRLISDETLLEGMRGDRSLAAFVRELPA